MSDKPRFYRVWTQIKPQQGKTKSLDYVTEREKFEIILGRAIIKYGPPIEHFAKAVRLFEFLIDAKHGFVEYTIMFREAVESDFKGSKLKDTAPEVKKEEVLEPEQIKDLVNAGVIYKTA